MARVIIENDKDAPVCRIEVREVIEYGEVWVDDVGQVPQGWAVGYCGRCDEWLPDRGNFEDTCEVVATHIDNHRWQE